MAFRGSIELNAYRAWPGSRVVMLVRDLVPTLEGGGRGVVVPHVDSDELDAMHLGLHGRRTRGARDERFNVEEFATLLEAQAITEAWRIEHNTYRPHSSLGDLTPAGTVALLDRQLRWA